MRRVAFAVICSGLSVVVWPTAAQPPVSAPGPSARLVAAPRLSLPGKIDSNSPLVWALSEGERRLVALTSFAGVPGRSEGSSLDALSPAAEPVTFISHPGDGIWMESVLEDDGGTWYGYYHHEAPADACGRPDRQIPRIGAARSIDHGRTWEDLGIIVESPPDSYACGSTNRFVMGGVGDPSAILDRESRDLYVFFSQYGPDPQAQGVAVARLAWADRDAPVGRVAIQQDGAWLPAQRDEASSAESGGTPWRYPLGTVLVAASKPWHDGHPAADAYWGPSVHWNTHLEQWVMLVNRARDETFNQDGIYVSFNRTLGDPAGWSAPREVLNGGGWYGQVAGLEPGSGTDKLAGHTARFFVTGRSEHLIEFRR